jgi:membrane protein implicated in regulation of membrane protease activity
MQWNIQPSEVWMIIGFSLIFIELIKLPGFGLLFLGLGSLTVSIILASEKIELSQYAQFAIFIVSTCIWFGLLWKPLKNFNSKKSSKTSYLDMIGEDVVVIGDKITPGLIGQVKWSGTLMNATLESTANKPANVGDIIVIKEVMGNVLICGFKE